MKTEEDLSENSSLERLTSMTFGGGFTVRTYPESVNEVRGARLFIGREKENKFLYLLATDGVSGTLDDFAGEEIHGSSNGTGILIRRCPLNHHNASQLQKLFPFTRPVTIGLRDSFGFGDRLGLANPGHIRSLNGYNFKPVLAQQSIRELTRTNRTPEDVMDAAVWAVFQEGYKSGFGADADHLKTIADVDLLVKAGYTMFTIDPSDHVVSGVGNMSDDELKERTSKLAWSNFQDSYAGLLARYDHRTIILSDALSLKPASREIHEACLKYNAALVHIKRMHDYLKSTYPKHECEIEVSIDETDTVTTPFEHFYIVNELNRLNIAFISLAPRFVGDFEKGIDYKGSIDLFKSEYLKHVAIAEHFGSYKISFHSGSDKFRVYEAVGEINRGNVHIKTAGTSYLEALKVLAIREPDLFREILDYAVGLYETEKKSYHVSGDMKKIKPGKNYRDDELENMFASEAVRQALHVTYGRVLTEKKNASGYTFRSRIYDCLNRNEDLHYGLLVRHFHRHMDPFRRVG